MLSGLQLVLAIRLKDDHRIINLHGRGDKAKPPGPLVLQGNCGLHCQPWGVQSVETG